MRMKCLNAMLATCLSVGAVAASAKPLPDLRGGETGRIAFNSITPPNRHEFARLNLQSTPSVVVEGDLLMPKNSSAGTQVPAVVLSHGSGGVESNMFDVWAKELNAAGYAVMITDSYKPRGVSETNSDQSRVPYPAHVADTLNALRMLATHPQIDANKIFNIGFSRGGSAAFDTAWPTWQRPVNTNGAKFAGHVVYYPGNCNTRFRTDDREQQTAPIYVLLADRNNEEAQDVAVCERWYDEMNAKGANIQYKEYKGARHGFDGLNFNYHVNPVTSSGKECDLEIYMTTVRGGGLGKNGYDFKAKKQMKSFDDFTQAMKCLTMTPGSRGGGNAREVQAEAVADTLNFLNGLK